MIHMNSPTCPYHVIFYKPKSFYQGGMIQASDLRSGSAKSRGRPLSGKRELHGYDGPMQYLSRAGNPDDMTTVQVESAVLMKNAVAV